MPRRIRQRMWFAYPFCWMGNPPLEAGYSTLGIAENASAMSYRRNLARRQEAMVDAISAEALEGEPLDVVWNPDTGCQPDFCQCSVW